MMKSAYFSLFICLTICASTFISNAQNDSLKERKHAVGVFISPASTVFWNLSDYDLHHTDDGSDFRFTVTDRAFPSGISYQYYIGNTTIVQTGICFGQEKKLFSSLGVSQWVAKTIDYKIKYFDIPLTVKLFPARFNDFLTRGGLFFQPGFAFDILIHEDITSTTSTSYSSNTFHQPVPDPNFEHIHSYSDKLKLFRICPVLAIGHELIGKRYSFFFSINANFNAFYQSKNKVEYFKTTKVSLMNCGWSYHF